MSVIESRHLCLSGHLFAMILMDVRISSFRKECQYIEILEDFLLSLLYSSVNMYARCD